MQRVPGPFLQTWRQSKPGAPCLQPSLSPGKNGCSSPWAPKRIYILLFTLYSTCQLQKKGNQQWDGHSFRARNLLSSLVVWA